MTAKPAAKKKPMRAKTIIGWREWVGLPDLGVALIKAKIDTGAKTSALHAFEPEVFEKEGERWVRFKVHPVQGADQPEIPCEAKVTDEREVTSSNGQKETRLFITTRLRIGPYKLPVELSLTNRDELGFRVLIGRVVMKKRFLVDSGRSFAFGEPDDGEGK